MDVSGRLRSQNGRDINRLARKQQSQSNLAYPPYPPLGNQVCFVAEMQCDVQRRLIFELPQISPNRQANRHWPRDPRSEISAWIRSQSQGQDPREMTMAIPPLTSIGSDGSPLAWRPAGHALGYASSQGFYEWKELVRMKVGDLLVLLFTTL